MYIVHAYIQEKPEILTYLYLLFVLLRLCLVNNNCLLQWSYGVVLWELLTRGVTPYPDTDNSAILEYIKGGNRLKKPKQCPDEVYVVIYLAFYCKCYFLS